ncbi:C-type lectin 37Db-like [Drosophila montana]|uniref:C-type lectin 37Db-like n=1 Tax=Drosophila montana TaxID=40370 RepID=UPI00313C13FD
MFRTTLAALMMLEILTGLSISGTRIAEPSTAITISRLGIPAGYNPSPLFKKFGTGYYYIPEAGFVTWYTALHNCHSIGGHLISLSKIEALHELSSYIKNTTHSTNYWLDLTDLGKEGHYVSMSSGMRPSYVDWCDNEEPINSNTYENCVNIENTNSSRPCMKSLSCDFLRSYICQSHTPRTISIVVL